MSFVTENSMKSHYKRLSCRTIKINGVRLDLEVYKTPDGMTFEVVEHVPDTVFDDNYVSRHETPIPWDKIVDAPEEPLPEETEDDLGNNIYGGPK